MTSRKSAPPAQDSALTDPAELLSNLPLPAALIAPDGFIQAATPVFWAALNLEPESVQTLADLCDEPLPAAEEPLRLEVRRGETGTTRPALLHPLDGDEAGYVLHLEPARGWENHLIEALPIGLFLVNADGAITAFNPALGGLLDIDPQSLLGDPHSDLFDLVADRASEPEVVRGSLHQAVVALDERPIVEVTSGSEPRQHLEFTFFPLWRADHDKPGWGCLVEDITEARDQLAWKLELLSMLAHDIRTPLATLKGHATALLANYQRWSDAMVVEFLEAMDHGTDELVRQVDRSLALTRVEAGRLGLRPEAVQAQDLVNGALERAASALGEVQVEAELPGDLPDVRVDPARIEEVLVNLLENASRYSPPDVPIRVEAQTREAMMVFSVVDAGPGVPQEHEAAIFEKHGQVDADHGGSGLGLFISRKIVEAHGGTIWVTSPPSGQEQGARFSFTVPLMPQEPLTEESPQPAAGEKLRPRTGAHALVVEDETDLQSLLRAVLTEAGYQVTLVADGPSAIDRLHGQEPDLVVLDLNLPRMDGLTVCRTIRRWSYVPILVLTSRTSTEDLVEAVDAGADDYLTKPFHSTELLARLRALLRRRERWGRTEAEPGPLRADGLTIDEARREARLNGRPIELTPTQFELLVHLARHRGQVLTHQQLIEHLWPQGGGNRHALFVHINRLRDKLEPDPDQPQYIVTRWGVGYAFLPRRSL